MTTHEKSALQEVFTKLSHLIDNLKTHPSKH